MSRRRLLIFCSVGFSLFLGIASLEMGFRFWWPQRLLFEGIGLFQPDRDLGFRLAPLVARSGEPMTNSLGLREREFSLHPPEGTTRILALGDSFTFGVTKFQQTWPKLLESKLLRHFPDRRIEVINGGFPGFSTYQEAGMLARTLLRLEPEIVILGFFVGNDFLENIRGISHTANNGEILSFKAVEDTHFEPPNPREAPLDTVHWRETIWPKPSAASVGTTDFLHGFTGWFYRLHLLRFIRRRLLATGNRPLIARVSPPTPGPAGVSPTPSAPRKKDNPRKFYLYYQIPRLAIYDRKKFPKRAISNTNTYLQRIAELLRKRGIPFVVLIIPDELQVHEDRLQFVLQRAQLSRETLDMDLPRKILKETLRCLQVDSVDPLPAFRRAARKKRLYKPWDTHWNEAGNGLGAQLVSRYLGTWNLKPPLHGKPLADCP